MAGHQAPTLQLGCCSNATADTSSLELARISSESNLMRDEEHGPLIIVLALDRMGSHGSFETLGSCTTPQLAAYCWPSGIT